MNKQALKQSIVTHTNNKDLEQIYKGTRTMYENLLRGKTKLTLVKMLLDDFDEVASQMDRNELIDKLVEIQFETMFGGEE
jgi:hypothetical protein